MMDELVLHTSTRDQLERFAAQPNHAVLLVGADGIGKATLAALLAAHALGVHHAELANHPYVRVVRPDKNTISIEEIRGLQHFLQLKTPGSNPWRRVIIMEASSALTLEAQNAFLKLLEEPPADTLLILTAHSPRSLLPTIMSRLQVITVHVPESAALQEHFERLGKDQQDIQRAYFMSGGLPGLMHALLHDDQEHPLIASVALAKELLQKDKYERLAMVERLSKQREEAVALVEALQRIAQAGINQAAQKGDKKQLTQWHTILKQVHAVQRGMRYNANAKLLLTNLVLNI